jgi:hypothetical protein
VLIGKVLKVCFEEFTIHDDTDTLFRAMFALYPWSVIIFCKESEFIVVENFSDLKELGFNMMTNKPFRYRHDYRMSREWVRCLNHPKLYKITNFIQNILLKVGISIHNSFANECTQDFSCCAINSNPFIKIPRKNGKKQRRK